VLAAVPVSTKNHPSGISELFSVLAKESKFCVTAVPTAASCSSFAAARLKAAELTASRLPELKLIVASATADAELAVNPANVAVLRAVPRGHGIEV
jgi:hypothetical protein